MDVQDVIEDASDAIIDGENECEVRLQWKKYVPHDEADSRIKSARAVTKGVLQLIRQSKVGDGVPLSKAHVSLLLNTCLWMCSEAEPKNKYLTRYCSVEAKKILLRCKAYELPKLLRHDHVFERAHLRSELLNAPDDETIESILDKVVACTVTKDEHDKLTLRDMVARRNNCKLYGWERYRSGRDFEGIVVVDTDTDKQPRIPDAIGDGPKPFGLTTE